MSNRIRGNLKGRAKDAFNWLISKTRDAQKGKTDYHARPKIGNLYLFTYQAKHEKTLPYWDKNPLMMPIEYYKDGWLGLNFHYLPPSARAKLFSYLQKYQKGFDDQRTLELSYRLLKGTSTNRMFRPCIKRYLYSYTRSRFAYIPPAEWDRAILIPTHKFQKQKAARVWLESMGK